MSETSQKTPELDEQMDGHDLRTYLIETPALLDWRERARFFVVVSALLTIAIARTPNPSLHMRNWICPVLAIRCSWVEHDSVFRIVFECDCLFFSFDRLNNSTLPVIIG